jgi:hypothetical protein
MGVWDELKPITAWLSEIKETDPATINAVLSKCKNDPAALKYFRGKAIHEGDPPMKEISTALVKAQKAFGPALKTSNNPHFKSRYAALDACVDAVLDSLNANGIALVQKTHDCADGVAVETVFLHESGESMSCGILHVPAAKSDPQGYGSALTYARRYSLMAACGIAPEDDDGNAASAKPSPRQPAPSSKVEPPAEFEANPIERVLEAIGKAGTTAEARSIGLSNYKQFDADNQALIKAAVEKRKGELK